MSFVNPVRGRGRDGLLGKREWELPLDDPAVQQFDPALAENTDRGELVVLIGRRCTGMR
jgi:hypothetical protein